MKPNVLENPYFDLLAELGVTIHPEGLRGTHKLIELCRIREYTSVLDVGCGVGITACFLAKDRRCRVVGLDISGRMIDRAKERVYKYGLEDGVEFRIADSQNIPFKDNFFDAVISESVTAFAEDKQKAISEYVRVTKPGGYIGLNETSWIKPDPPEELVDYTYRVIGGVSPVEPGVWYELLERAGLKGLRMEIHKLSMLNQIMSEIKRVGLTDHLKSVYRLFNLYITSPVYRKAINQMTKDGLRVPWSLLNFFGYGIYVGRK